MMNPSRFLMLSGVLLAMAACSPAVRQGPPAPIIGPGGSGAPAPTAASSGNVSVTPLKAPEITPVDQEPVQTFRRPESATESTPEPVPASAPRDDEREQVALAKPRTMSKAVKTLVDQAELQRAAGDLTGAAATLERALRIEPDTSGTGWPTCAPRRVRPDSQASWRPSPTPSPAVTRAFGATTTS